MSQLHAAAEYKKERWPRILNPLMIMNSRSLNSYHLRLELLHHICSLFVLAGVPSLGHYRLTYQKSQREHESCTKTSSDSPRPLKRQKITIDINLPSRSMGERHWAPLGISQARLQQRERGEIWGGRGGTGGALWHLSKDVYVNSEWPTVEGSQWLYRWWNGKGMKALLMICNPLKVISLEMRAILRLFH